MVTKAKNIQLYHLHLVGDFRHTGFGFSCLKQACALNIAGNLRYISEQEVEMNLEGNSKQLTRFLSWCKTSTETKSLNISDPMDNLIGLTDFDIINSL